MALKTKCSEKKNIYACFLHSYYFCRKCHIEFWEIVWNICLYKCSLKNAGSKIDVSLCVAFPCGTQRRCEARPGRCRHSCALVPCTVTYLWAALGALDHVWQLSVCVISVSFGLYVRIRECVCIHVWWCECVRHTAVHWPPWPLLERFCMAAIFDPCLPRGPCSFADSTQCLRCSTYTHVMSALEFQIFALFAKAFYCISTPLTLSNELCAWFVFTWMIPHIVWVVKERN